MIALAQGSYPWASGIWTGVIFAISGGLTIVGGKSGKWYLMITSMVFSIISAVLAGVLVILSSIILSVGAPYTYVYSDLPPIRYVTNDQYNSATMKRMIMIESNRLSYWKYVAPFHIILILVGLVMLATSILASFKICLVTCCCCSRKDEVYYLKTGEGAKQSYDKYQPPPPYNV